MKSAETVFVIPTYRLRDVAETVEKYDDNFWSNGHTLKMIIFDDSSLVNYQKYYSLLEQTKTKNDIFYVGPHEKEQFISLLNERLKDKKLESLVRSLFRPSYGGNRNFTLMYTLGHRMVSSDDDMRPYALVETSLESLSASEVSRGKLLPAHDPGFISRSYDLITAFEDVLGKKVSQIPDNYELGEYLQDTTMDLETNTSKGYFRESSLLLSPGEVLANATVKIAQTFRTGTNDIDTLDFLNIYLNNESQRDPESLNELYVLVNFRPVVTNKNWRMDCGVAGYDNRLGLSPFFPTRLRFEDYIYRLWIQQDDIVAAHVDAAQNHTRNNYMRSPLVSEIFNEEISNLLKLKIKNSIYFMDDLTIKFEYMGEVALEDSEEILQRVSSVYEQLVFSAHKTQDEERKQSLQTMAANLHKVFYGFEPDFFQQNVSRIVDDVVSQFHAALEIWPTLVEICYFQKHKRDLPISKVENVRSKKLI